jgi:flagellar biosynthesis protein FliR
MYYFVYHFQVFLLIMMRMSSMMLIAPFYASGVIPFRMRALLSFLITLVIFPIVAQHGYDIPGHMGSYALLVVQEVFVGLFVGFLVSVIVSSFQLAGEYFSVQIGFGINEVLDPLAQVSVPLVGQLKNLIGLLIFLVIGGHHFLIKAIYRSYELVPVVSLGPGASAGMLKFLTHIFSGMFVVALKIALPVMATVFLVSVTMGVLSKAAPQMNIMMLGFPLKIMVAFGVIMLTSPLIVRVMYVSLDRTFKFVEQMLLRWPV